MWVFGPRDWPWLIGTWLTGAMPTLMFLATVAVLLWLVFVGPPTELEAP